MASAVRCPNSASKTAASASRRPARRLRTRSSLRRSASRPGGRQAPTPSTRTVTPPSSRPEQPDHGGADGVADLLGERHQALARAGDQPAASRGRARRGRGCARASPPIASRQRGPPRPTRTTPGTSSAASRTVSRITPGPTESVDIRRLPPRCRPRRPCRVPGVRASPPSASRDPLRDALASRRGTHADGMLDHAPLRAAVGDDHGAPDAQQRRAADHLVVEDRADPPDAGAHQQVREAAADRARELGPEQVEDVAGQALEELDHDVAEDRVADDDVGRDLRSGPCPRRCR